MEEETTLTTETFSNQRQGGRRARRDRGSHQVSERDVELLKLIGEQYAITLDQLARLIGRTYRTARGLRDRWCNAGWTDSAKLAVELPPFVWLTGRGSRLVESPFRTWDAGSGLATHIEAVTKVRLLLEHELRLGTWECERAIAQRWPSRSEARHHLPDGILTNNDQTQIAIEVELTLKSRTRLQAIINELSQTHQQVWYFTPERLLPTLSTLAGAAPYGNVTVRRYPPLAAEVAAVGRGLA
jgi:hypothetical protein